MTSFFSYFLVGGANGSLIVERSPSDSGQSGCLRLLAHWLVLSFFARSDRPLSFVPAQVTGETTYTRRTARSPRAPFAEDTQFRRKGEILNRARERGSSPRAMGMLARPRRNPDRPRRDRNIGRVRDRFEREIRGVIYAFMGGQEITLPASLQTATFE